MNVIEWASLRRIGTRVWRSTPLSFSMPSSAGPSSTGSAVHAHSGRHTGAIVAEERRLFYVALTRAVEQLVIVTERGSVSPFIEELLGDPSLVPVRWMDFPPAVGASATITVTVGNQTGRGGNGTFAIRNRLKAEGYRWDGAWRHWWRTVPAEGFSIEQFIARSSWSADSEGVQVSFRDSGERVLAEFHVIRGQWMS